MDPMGIYGDLTHEIRHSLRQPKCIRLTYVASPEFMCPCCGRVFCRSICQLLLHWGFPKRSSQKKTTPCLVGGWTNPSEKYESKWVHLPQVGVNIQNLWNYQQIWKLEGWKMNCSFWKGFFVDVSMFLRELQSVGRRFRQPHHFFRWFDK